MKIKVGESVRTKSGFIGKVIAMHSGYALYYELNIKKEIQNNMMNGIVYEDNIVKHSKQLIDLIETGDIVECFVEEDVDGEDTIKYEVAGTGVTDLSGNKTNEIGICGESGVELIPFDNVRSILTHEQFERNCYRLEE